jgi:peroxiredoxin
MNRITLVCLAAALILIWGCTGKKNYVVQSDISGLTDGYAYLQVFGDEGLEIVDSALIEKGTFVFKGEKPEPEFIYITFSNAKGRIGLFLENAKMTLTGHADTLTKIRVNGSELNDEYAAFKTEMEVFEKRQSDLYQQYTDAQSKSDTAMTRRIEKMWDLLDNEQNKFIRQYISDKKASVISPFLIHQRLIYSIGLQELDSLNGIFPKEIQNTVYAKKLRLRAEILRTVEPGQPAPEITLDDTLGIARSLSSLKGKYVLIDFWASWCGPCRAESPNLVKAYNQYHDKGFEIFGVSLDKDRKKWIDAIKADNLTWWHVSDLKGWQCTPAKTYGVNSIPHSVLIDPEGVIIAKGLRGDALDARLKELFN